MGCTLAQLKNVKCVNCERSDHVYVGHGTVRFCAHCSLSWDPSEDKLPYGKTVIEQDEVGTGELPEDITSRMGILMGRLESVFGFERRMHEFNAIPEALFLEAAALKGAEFLASNGKPHNQQRHGRGRGGGGSEFIETQKSPVDETTGMSLNESKHLPGKHPQGRHGRGGRSDSGRSNIIPSPKAGEITRQVLEPDQWQWQGKPRKRPEKTLSKLQTGELGERIAMQALTDRYGKPFGGLNVERNNEPIDVFGDHVAAEVKAGMSYNKSGTAWRATEGQMSSGTRKWLKGLPPKKQKEYKDGKRRQITERKIKKLQEIRASLGGEFVAGKMIGVILSPDGKTGDVFEVDGFHRYLGWKKHATKNNYMGTYTVSDAIFADVMSKTMKVADLEPDHPIVERLEDWELDMLTPDELELMLRPHIWEFLRDMEDAIDMRYLLDLLVEESLDPDTLTDLDLAMLWNKHTPDEILDLDAFLKHMPGGKPHDQRRHGRGGGSGRSFSGDITTTGLTVADDQDFQKGAFDSFLVITGEGEKAIAKPDALNEMEGREVLAYRLSEASGYGRVPETVNRENVGGEPLVSVQKWVDQPTASERMDMKAMRGESVEVVSDVNDFKKQQIFDYAIGNHDRHQSNYLVDEKGHITSIDNHLMSTSESRNLFGFYTGNKEADTQDSYLRAIDHLQLTQEFGNSPRYRKSDFDFILDNQEAMGAEIAKMNKMLLNEVDLESFNVRVEGLRRYRDRSAGD